MTRLFLAVTCFVLLILVAFGDKEYEEHGHDDHHHHHFHHDHDGRKFILFLYQIKLFF
jgi:hypothetical protein